MGRAAVAGLALHGRRTQSQQGSDAPGMAGSASQPGTLSPDAGADEVHRRDAGQLHSLAFGQLCWHAAPEAAPGIALCIPAAPWQALQAQGRPARYRARLTKAGMAGAGGTRTQRQTTRWCPAWSSAARRWPLWASQRTLRWTSTRMCRSSSLNSRAGPLHPHILTQLHWSPVPKREPGPVSAFWQLTDATHAGP